MFFVKNAGKCQIDERIRNKKKNLLYEKKIDFRFSFIKNFVTRAGECKIDDKQSDESQPKAQN